MPDTQVVAAATPALPADPLGVEVHRLDNGLAVYLSEHHEEPRIVAYIAVKAGSAEDPPEATGMAHYLEHMLFKGSRRLGTTDFATEVTHLDRIQKLYDDLFATQDQQRRQQIYAEIDRENVAASRYAIPNDLQKVYDIIGAQAVNAATSVDYTVYMADIPSNQLQRWAITERDRFENPVFRLFQTEIETVYEEKNRALDNPGRALRAAVFEPLFRGHPYAVPTIGTVEHLKNPSLSKMMEFYSRWYVPENMAVILAGDFQPATALTVLNAQLGRWLPKVAPKRESRQPTALTGVHRVELAHSGEEQVMLAWQTVGDNHPDADALTLLDMILDNSTTGLLNLDLTQTQKVRHAGSYAFTGVETGAEILQAIPRADQALEDVESLLLAEVAKLRGGEFSQEDIDAIVTNFEVSQKRTAESSSSRVQEMFTAFVRGVSWDDHRGRLERMRRLRRDDIVRVANRYFGPSFAAGYRRNGTPEIPKVTAPAFTHLDLDAAKRSVLFNEIAAMKTTAIAPKFLSAGADYQVQQTLAGPLYVAANPYNDIFDLALRFDVGSDHDGKLCLAVDLLDKAGAAGMDAGALKRSLYAMGVSLRYSCTPRSLVAGLDGPERHLSAAWELFVARLYTPELAPDDLRKWAENTIARRERDLDNPKVLANGLGLFAMLGKESPFLRAPTNVEVTALSLADVSRALGNLRQYARTTYYVGSGSAGDISALVAAQRETLTPPPKLPPERYVDRGADTVLFVDHESVQSLVAVTAGDEILDLENVPIYGMYNEYVDGSMGGIIFQEIREARALAYAASCRYSAGSEADDQNGLHGYLGTQADKTVESTRLLLDLIRHLPVLPQRFTEAKEASLQAMLSNRIGFRAVPTVVDGWVRRGYRDDPRPEIMAKTEVLSLQEVAGFAARFAEKPLTVAVVGDADRIDLTGLRVLGAFEQMGADDLFSYHRAQSVQTAASAERTIPGESVDHR
ncbi:MAG: insulinase family protein [Candidatus Schekmanbacteria bacterium]|nr:insulinase family protein [Candidatus Schekmanbacteria bacterium]